MENTSSEIHVLAGVCVMKMPEVSTKNGGCPNVMTEGVLYRNSHVEEPGLRGGMMITGVLGFVVTSALFLSVPFVDMISRGTNERKELVAADLAKPPPPPPPEEIIPPSDKKITEETLELHKPRPRIKLKQLELSLDPGPRVVSLSGDLSFDFSLEETDVIFEWGEVDKDPRFISKMPPVYPFSLSKNGIEGEVLLECILSPDGRITSIKVIKGSGVEFIKSAITALKKSKFKPGKKDGKAVPVRVRVPFDFSLSMNKR